MVDIKANIKKLAEKAKMSEADLDKLYEEIKQDFTKRGVPEDRMKEMILARMQATLKRQFVTVGAQGTQVRAVLIGRMRATDWAEWNRQKTIEKCKNMDEDEAIQAGCKNASGQLLYTAGGKYSIGKVIPKHDWSATGFGIVTYDKEGKLDTRFAEFKLKGEAAIEPIELFKEADMVVRLIDGTDDNKFVVGMGTLPLNYDDHYINFHDYAKYVSAAESKRIISLGEIEAFAQVAAADDSERFNNWAIVEGNVIKFGVSTKGLIGVSIDDPKSTEDEESSYTIWYPEGTDFDFNNNAIGVTFLVTTMISQDDGSTVLFGIGYWTEDYFRIELPEVEEDATDVQDSWG